MHTPLQTVQLNEISLSELFFVTTEGRDNAALQQSIATCGLLQPPCLWRSGVATPYRVICGYRRVFAVRSLGWQELSVRVFDPLSNRNRYGRVLTGMLVFSLPLIRIWSPKNPII